MRLNYSSSIILVAWYELFCRNILSLCVCDISIADADMNAKAKHTPNLSTEFSPSLCYSVNEHLFTSTRYSQCRNIYSMVLVYLPSCILDMINMAARQTDILLSFFPVLRTWLFGKRVSTMEAEHRTCPPIDSKQVLWTCSSYFSFKNRYFSFNLVTQ